MKKHVGLILCVVVCAILCLMASYYAGKAAGNVEMFEKLYEADLIKEGSLKE